MSTIIRSALLFLLFIPSLWAQPVELKAGAPDRYVVKPNDTIWHIADRFLKEPWQWRLLIEKNPQINDPRKLYPGQVLVLKRGPNPKLDVRPGGTVKLSPNIRTSVLKKAIPTIPADEIKPFLSEIKIISKNEFKGKAYVLRPVGDRLVVGADQEIYVLGLKPQDEDKLFRIYRKDKPLVDPDTKKTLGYSALYLGDARMLRNTKPAVMMVTKSSGEIKAGDSLIPIEKDETAALYFYPKVPKLPIKGKIISVAHGDQQVAQFSIVTINRGSNSHVEVGDLFSVMQSRGKVDSPVERGILFKKKVQLPDQSVGKLIVFKVYDKVSFGLILSATGTIHLKDTVSSPEIAYSHDPLPHPHVLKPLLTKKSGSSAKAKQG